MNKSAGVLLGIVVAIGAISVGGAWYTGTKLEAVLQSSLVDANNELKTVMVGSNGSASVELVSLDRSLFSSTAHYRLKAQGEMFGDRPDGIELLFVDRIEHGPLPFSRLLSLKWLPVMATSHYALEKSALTEKWFAATQGESPAKGVVNIGYDNSTFGTLELLPVDTVLDDASTLKFSGLNLEVSANAKGQKVKANGYMDSLVLTGVAQDQTPVKVELHGLTMASNVSRGAYGFYLGDNLFELSSAKATLGEKQSVLALKKIETKGSTSESGTLAAGRVDYSVGDITLNDKPIGSAKMAWSMKNFEVPSALSLMEISQTRLQPYQEAAAAAAEAGEPVPDLNLSDAELAQIQTALEGMLAAQPQMALENLSLTTPNGESRASLVVDLTKPSSFELPTPQLLRQMISQLDFSLVLSKPMLADLFSVQAQLEGQTNAKAIGEQAADTSVMVASMAVGSHFAKPDGDNVVIKLNYANNQVDLNGQKMPVEQFVGFVMRGLASLGAL
ncbi:Uncharacterized conserved protein YdgA, DUF945 family [Pseudomonas sp. ok272]|uniref:YdgA family protein n=1 Tax=unclassified Pseudomonas TaxID=196821 RepID=UPI0008C2ACBA|nr:MULTISPECIES: YdgA family protein [unclassified Pseudomonas]SEN44713.1 Uncharacterized conserved protein YdgA, DUF945 family [Pseudomonas sp. ok272]SFM80721.1 Uncharacterized conserved protein YdgA, DUF945 family [Pseudomonas sp. ok602]